MSRDFFVKTGSKPRKNSVTPLMNGEVAWKEVYSQILKAKRTVYMCFWGFDSGLELLREVKQAATSRKARKSNIIYNLLERKRKQGVKVKVLLWAYPFHMKSDFADTLMKLTGDVGIMEVMYQPHPTRTVIGSWHQKTIIIDGIMAFVSGMNAKENDWDTSEHKVFDPRRIEYALSVENRKKIISKKLYKSLHPPRRDYMALVMGPAVAEVDRNFVERWNFCLKEKFDYYKHAKPLKPIKPMGEVSNGVMSQITRTVPKYSATPAGENSILDSYRKAIALAKDYVYIEDQYFRCKRIANDLADAMKRNKRLIVFIVVTPDYLSEIEPGEAWKMVSPSTYWTADSFDILEKAKPGFRFYYLQGCEKIRSQWVYKTVDIHSKLMIVDDEWYTLGSANVNDRSFDYDGELNVAVQDGSAKDFRKTVFTNLFGEACPDDIHKTAKLWFEHAAYNFKAWRKGSEPKSKIFPYAQKGPVLPVTFPDWV